MRQIWITKYGPPKFSPSGKRPIPNPSRANCVFASKRAVSTSLTSWAAMRSASPDKRIAVLVPAPLAG